MPDKRTSNLAAVGKANTPGELLEVQPGPFLAMSSGSWSYSVGGDTPRGVYREVKQSGVWGWRLVSSLPHVLEVVTHRDAMGGLRSLDYRLAMDRMDPHPVTCPLDELLSGAEWIGRLGLPPLRDQRTIAALVTALGQVAQDAPQVEAVPGWTATGLALPPGEVGPRGYGTTIGDEAAGLAAWREIAGILAKPANGRAALFAGMALAGPLIGVFDRQSFIAHACGGSSGGKSTALRLAGALFGPAGHVVGTWNLSPVARSEDLLRLGVFPGFRDEIGMLGRMSPREAEALIMQVAEGGARGRTRRQGGTDVSARWRSVLLSTGNDSLLGMATEQEGIPVRVVELEAPLVEDKATAQRLTVLSNAAAGWPLYWLRRQVSVAQAWELLATADRDVGADAESGAIGRIGQNLATGVAGAALLEMLTGVPGVRAAALAAAADAYAAAVAEMEETAMRQGDRLVSVIAEAIASNPSAFPPKELYAARVAAAEGLSADPAPSLSGVLGVTYESEGERRVAVLRTKLAEVAAAGGIVSARSGLRELRKDGRLVCESYESRPTGLTLREWLGDSIGQVACYVFRRLPDDLDKPRPELGGAAVADLPLMPMPPLAPGLSGLDLTAPLGGATIPATDPAPAPVEASPAAQQPAAVTEPPRAPEGDAPQEPPSPAPASVSRNRRLADPSRPVTVWAVLADVMVDQATGRSYELPPEACTDLAVLVTGVCRASTPGDVTLILDEAAHERYGLPIGRPSPGREPWTKAGKPAKGTGAAAFVSLVEQGWHPPHKPGELPRVMPVTTLEHATVAGRVRIMPMRWVRAGEFPRGDSDPDGTDAREFAARLLRMRELTGWTWASSPGSTALEGLRSVIEATAKRAPRWLGTADRWPHCTIATVWERDRTEAGSEVVGFDAVKNYLGGYGSAIVAADDLQWSIDPDLSRPWAGLVQITVPTWPHRQVPAPVADLKPGERTWVSAAIVKLYADLDIEVAVHEGWTAPAVGLQGFRTFQTTIRDALDGLEATDTDAKGKPTDPAAAALWAGLKALYRTCHGKLQDPRQRRLVRPDWGYAVRDQAWANTLRKVYRAAGMLPLSGGGWVSVPRYPVKVDTDELVYPVIDGHPADQPPEGLTVGRSLGQFRIKTGGDDA